MQSTAINQTCGKSIPSEDFHRFALVFGVLSPHSCWYRERVGEVHVRKPWVAVCIL